MEKSPDSPDTNQTKHPVVVNDVNHISNLSGTKAFKKVEIIRPVPSFICPFRFIVCGPYDAGELVELPVQVADLLIRKGRAIERRS